MTTQQDDFLAQILEAETNASQVIIKANERSRAEQIKWEALLSEKRAESLSLEKEKAKNKLQEKQISVKVIYNELLKEGEKEATQLKQEAAIREDVVLASTESAFLETII
jgi:vacuolar-type H+-ATPase subunit H